MEKKLILDKIYKQIIVSCQARKGWAMYGSNIMSAFAVAACEGGAGGIRANGVVDITAIKEKVNVPVIGINKIWQEGYEVYITPTYDSAKQILETGIEIIALDATTRQRPNGETAQEIISNIRKDYPNVLIMGEISTIREAKFILNNSDIDLISTTLSGYTQDSENIKEANLKLISDIVKLTSVPVIAEGKFQTIEEIGNALKLGAHSVVVGTSITRPEIITARYVQGVNNYLNKF